MCRGTRSMTSNTDDICASVNASWKRSLIEFTKIRRDSFHFSGIESRSGMYLGANPTGNAFPSNFSAITRA